MPSEKTAGQKKELRNLVNFMLSFLNFKRYFEFQDDKRHWCFWLFLSVHEKQRPRHRTSSDSFSEWHMEVSPALSLKALPSSSQTCKQSGNFCSSYCCTIQSGHGSKFSSSKKTVKIFTAIFQLFQAGIGWVQQFEMFYIQV